MRPVKSGTRKQRIILYYTIAVVIPGIILGYMAYRGILNDQMVREQETRRRLQGNSQEFFAAVDSSLNALPDRQPVDSSGSRQPDPSILVSFITDSTGSHALTNNQLLYLPSRFCLKRDETLFSREKLNRGAVFEFQEQKRGEALSIYKDLAVNSGNPAEKDLALIALARIYRKMNQVERAMETYEDIRDNYAGRLLNGQIPMGLSADLELCRISQDARDTAGFNRNAGHLLRLLLKPACTYDESQFELFYSSLAGMVPAGNHELDSLFRQVEHHKLLTDYLIRLINDNGMVVNTGNRQVGDAGAGYLHIPVIVGDMDLLVLRRRLTDGTSQVMVIDFTKYMKSIAEGLVHRINVASNVSLEIRNESSDVIYKKAGGPTDGYLSFSFPADFPRWRLLLRETRSGFLVSVFSSGSGFYLSIFILITLLMIMGLVFTIYTLNQELRLNKLKSEFISNVSHELKSPLTSIRQMTEMLDQDRVQTEERRKAYYSSMLEQSEHLSHLIDNILDFSRLEDERKKYHFTDVDLNDLLSKFLETARERHAENGFRIGYAHPENVPLISGDKDALLQVFYNLVDNAVKYSGDSKLVEVILMVRSYELVISIRDHGIGIPKQDQDKIFERFYRCEEPQLLGIKGSGIGLTIVKRIVEAHKGSLTLVSIPGEGSTFSVHIPLNEILAK